jgi:hypothetical protein
MLHIRSTRWIRSARIVGVLLGVFLIWGGGKSETASSTYPQSQKTQIQTASADAIANEEYAVYSALLAKPKMINGKIATLLVIGIETERPASEEVQRAARCHEDFRLGESQVKRGPSLLSSDARPLVEDLFSKNSQTYYFDRRFNFRRAYVLMDATDFRRFFDGPIAGFDAFYDKFRGAEGFKRLSRVGFNREKTQALVYVASAYTPIDIFTTFVLLRKEHGAWIKVEDFTCNKGRAGIKPEVP